MTLRPLRKLFVLLMVAFAVATCGSGPDAWDGEYEVDPICRNRPAECDGDIGARCAFEEDCGEGVCCLTDDCGGGMCTYLCGGPNSCPFGMSCRGGFCFFTCDSDDQCAGGQRCEHDRTVCQYRD